MKIVKILVIMLFAQQVHAFPQTQIQKPNEVNAVASDSTHAEEFAEFLSLLPLDAEKMKQPSWTDNAEESLQQTGTAWRRNSWGTCRAYYDCGNGRSITCYATGYNCNSFSESGWVKCESWYPYTAASNRCWR